MKSLTTLLIFSLPLLLTIGCGRNSKPASSQQQQTIDASGTIAKSMGHCEILQTRFTDNTAQKIEDEQHLDVERDLQRVQRKDCSGKLTSDEVETVVPPHVEITLHAPVTKKFQSVFVYNDATCDHLLTTMPIHNWPLIGQLYPITGNGMDEITIKGDISKALLTFQLKNGMNKIFVHYFYDCSPENETGNTHASVGETNCLQSKDSTIIEYPIVVNYSEKHLDGIKEVAPTVDECQTGAKK